MGSVPLTLEYLYQSTLKTLWIDNNLRAALPSATGKYKDIILAIFNTFTGTPYSKFGITAMCVEAMKSSFVRNTGLLKAGDFTVTALNLGTQVRVKLVGNGNRINSCYPLTN
jgi:hypothetical protein